MLRLRLFVSFCRAAIRGVPSAAAADYHGDRRDRRESASPRPQLEAAVRKKGYVSGVAAGSFLDKKTGFRDAGFGLDIVDWIMEPGSDEAYRDQLTPSWSTASATCTTASGRSGRSKGRRSAPRPEQLQPTVIRGKDFVAVRQQFKYRTAAPGKKTGSTWTQALVFPVGKRYFVSMDRIDAVNASDAMFLRIDMPGHIRHNKGDTFSQIYLSYRGNDPGQASSSTDFPPDEKFNYRRDRDPLPERFIRAYQLRDPNDGQAGPVAGRHDARSVGRLRGLVPPARLRVHDRGVRRAADPAPGESFSAAFLVGYFDSIDEMERTYTTAIAGPRGWRSARRAGRWSVSDRGTTCRDVQRCRRCGPGRYGAQYCRRCVRAGWAAQERHLADLFGCERAGRRRDTG